jgi:enediyne biosynthesis protein E4
MDQVKEMLFQNMNGRRFAEISRQSGSGFARDDVGRTLIGGDIDNDGDIDLVVTNNGGAVEVLRNTGGNARNSIEIRVVGTRSNRDGLGTRLTVTAGGRTQVREIKSGSSYLGQNDLRAHVGLGEAARVDRIDVRWPAGQTESIRDVAANQIVTVTEGKGLTSQSPFAR